MLSVALLMRLAQILQQRLQILRRPMMAIIAKEHYTQRPRGVRNIRGNGREQVYGSESCTEQMYPTPMNRDSLGPRARSS